MKKTTLKNKVLDIEIYQEWVDEIDEIGNLNQDLILAFNQSNDRYILLLNSWNSINLWDHLGNWEYDNTIIYLNCAWEFDFNAWELSNNQIKKAYSYLEKNILIKEVKATWYSQWDYQAFYFAYLKKDSKAIEECYLDWLSTYFTRCIFSLQGTITTTKGEYHKHEEINWSFIHNEWFLSSNWMYTEEIAINDLLIENWYTKDDFDSINYDFDNIKHY
jgi:hypothetical protein